MTQPLPARWSGDVLPAQQRVVMLVVVLANYAAQIPYALDLYGMDVNPSGVVLLLATLVWFLAGVALQRRGLGIGYWLLVSFLAVQVLFYFHGQILRIFDGYGLVYNIVHARDKIVGIVFLVGDVNFLAAGYFVVYLLLRRYGPVRSRTGTANS